jgi:Protein of unknown function (DUF559)
MDDRPFLGRAAIRQGVLTPYELRKNYRAIYRNVYLRKSVELTAAKRAAAAWLWADGECVLAGLSAAAVLGTKWLDPTSDAQIVRENRHSCPGIAVRSYHLQARETCLVSGMRITTPERTAFDIGRSMPRQRAVPILDALANATNLKLPDVSSLAEDKPRARGIRQLSATLELVDAGAESPQESRVRLLLVGAGLPAPETQIQFRDEFGHVFIRVDMGWREWKVAVEYDGVQHWADRYQRSWDIDRIAMLEAMGWTVVRVSAEMLSRPHVVIERVQNKLRGAGCPI